MPSPEHSKSLLQDPAQSPPPTREESLAEERRGGEESFRRALADKQGPEGAREMML